MLDLPPLPAGWLDGAACAVATIVSTRGSAPRPAGTSMLVRGDGALHGSLSGGCIEGAVVAAALECLADGLPRRECFGYDPGDAFAAGLTCGGELEVHLEPLPAHDGGASSTPGPTTAALASLAAFGPLDPVAVIRRVDLAGSGFTLVPAPAHIDPPRLHAELERLTGSAVLARVAAPQVLALAAGGRTGVVSPMPGSLGGAAACSGEAPVLLVESRLAPPRMIVFGANDFSEALLPLGRLLGYRTTLCDARSAFTHQPRFAAADELSIGWPHEYLAAEAAAGRIDGRTVLCVLTHDTKFDLPLLTAALDLDVAYLGAMGSRRSHDQRVAGLLAAGVDPAAIGRLHSPIGLDLQAITPAEVAVSIAAQVVADRSPEATGRPLARRRGPIHTPLDGPGRPGPVPAGQEPAWT